VFRRDALESGLLLPTIGRGISAKYVQLTILSQFVEEPFKLNSLVNLACLPETTCSFAAS
jgi:hypothetical protein